MKKGYFFQVIIFLLLIISISACQVNAQTQIEETEIAIVNNTFINQPSEHENIWFDQVSERRNWQTEDKLVAAQFVYSEISKTTSLIPDFIQNDDSPAIIFVSISSGFLPASIIIGRGSNFQGAVDELKSKINPDFFKLNSKYWVKVDIVDEVIHIPEYDLDDPLEHQRSLFGLAFDQTTELAFIPELLVTETIVNSNQKIILDNLEKHLIKLAISRENLDLIRKNDFVKIYRFSTWSFFIEENNEWLPLYRGHRVFQNTTQDQLVQAIEFSGRYLTNAVQENGSFVYEYFPKSDREADDYNLLRHAGTIYSMIEIWEITQDEQLMYAILRAIDYLLAHMKYCDTPLGQARCLVENDQIKLGGNGLSLVALTKFTQATGDQKHLSTMQSLARWIVSTQSSDGEFTIHKADFSSGEKSDLISGYYPGEAMLGLIRLYQIDKNEDWANAAEKGARWIIEVRDGGSSDDELDHDHWLLYALNEIHREKPNPIFLEHTSRLARVILDAKNENSPYLDWNGGFRRPPESTPSATRSEGVYAAYQLIRDYQSEENAKIILDGWKKIVAFQLGTQFYPESAMYLRNPQRVLGGFHKDLTNFSIRIDYVQHNISGLIGYYNIISQK